MLPVLLAVTCSSPVVNDDPEGDSAVHVRTVPPLDKLYRSVG
jgi:hypothetical protein